MNFFRRITILSLFACFLVVFTATAQPTADSTASKTAEPAKEGFNAREVIMGHIMDKAEWHFFTIKKSDGSVLFDARINLPVILYAKDKGLSTFSYGKFDDGKASYNGYRTDAEHHIYREDGGKFYDFSLTKNVIQLLISAILLIWMFTAVAKAYKRNGENAAPKGFQNAMETVIIFIRDEVAKPMLGEKAGKYLPYLLTVFFFIWVNNLIGLIPGSANVTGNIAVTMVLALCTFAITLFSSNKHYWGHLFNPPGVPMAVKPILILIEFLSIFTKPFALTIRLFANMVAGHLIVLSFISLIFIFAVKSPWAGIGMSPLSIGFGIFIDLLELLVAVLQAFIFTILSALFIGEAANAGHHEENHDGLHDNEISI